MSTARATLASLVLSLVLAACAGGAPSEVDLAEQIDASVKATVDALAGQPPASATPAPSQTPLPTSPPLPTASPVPTLPPAKVSVSVATNCRSGPALTYPRVTTLQPGQAARVTARSSVAGYWYIANPDQADEFCWLWAEFATVEGDVSGLPVLTPEPSPIPQVDFTLYRHSFSECGSTRVNLIIVNNGVATFKSARLHVEDLTTSKDLHGPRTDSSPFADNPSSCPSDKGSSTFPPGTTAYLVIPLKTFEAGNDAVAYVKLCTRADGKGNCVTKSAYFRLPED